MAKAPKMISMLTNPALLAYGYIHRPDDKAPDGANFTPNGKYKGTLVFDDASEVAELRAVCIAELKAKFGTSLPDEDELKLPMADADPKKGEEFEGKVILKAASQYQPKIYDATDGEAPKGVFPRSGDIVRFRVGLYVFSKVEPVREGKKTIQVTVYGVSLRLSTVQIVRKGNGGAEGVGGFGVIEGGYVAALEDARKVDEYENDETPASKPARTNRPAGDGDF